MKLAVVSNLDHYGADGDFRGATPAAVREIDALAALFDETVVVGCLLEGPAPPQAIPYRAGNLRLELLPPAGGRGPAGKLDALRALPARLAAVSRAWRDADAALVRCPSNVAVAALALASAGAAPPRLWVKYTGPWQGRPGEAWAYRAQRLWLRSGLSGATVTVGGLDADPGGGAATLCNPSLSAAEAEAADLATRDKTLEEPWRLLCAGRVVQAKGLDTAVRAAALLAEKGRQVRLDIAGDGPERAALAALASKLGVSVHFHGWLGDAELDALYRRAHVLVAPSFAEGWSRAWTEAAARRCPPAASPTGAALGLARSGAGLVISSGDPEVWAAEIERLLSDPAAWSRLASRGPLLARRFTYERFARQARDLLLAGGADAREALGEA